MLGICTLKIWLFKLKYTLVIFVFFLFSFSSVKAQLQDSTQLIQDSIQRSKAIQKKNYSHPRRAAIMSAVLPGLGQAYNKKYWKIPIIYAGLGGFGYMFTFNNKEYNFYRENLIALNDDNPNTINTTRYSSSDLQTLKNEYKKSRDLALFGIAVFYFLNIIDANVDGHLRTFDVSDDLSIHLDPWQMNVFAHQSYQIASGISIKLNFK